ncbi:MAG: hypothetical protein ACKVHQ_15515, partial [Gammaproteobacteria bacterium]
IIPFAFVLDESLLMRGSASDIAVAFTTAAIGAIALAAAIRGYSFKHMGIVYRIVLTVGALLLITPDEKIIGLVIVLLVLLAQHFLNFNQDKKDNRVA